MAGNFVAMFGLNPSTTTVLSNRGFLEVHLLVYGHDYNCLSSNILVQLLFPLLVANVYKPPIYCLLFQPLIFQLS